MLSICQICVSLTVLLAAHYMPPLGHQKGSQRRSSSYGAKTNHPTSYDNNPSFKGPLVLEELGSPEYYRRRIRGYLTSNEKSNESACDETIKTSVTLSTSSSTATIIKSIVEHLARKDAPVDVKEVVESTEFYLRSGKRLFGAARRILKNKMKNSQESDASVIAIHDLCCGHGLTAMMFVACNPRRGNSRETLKAVLVDQSKPQSHEILKDIISEVCPWVTADSIKFEASSLEEFVSGTNNIKSDASIVVSTHACGSLTDKVLNYAVDNDASAIAVMPCCYTGTDHGVPYGLRRILGVSLAADTRRSFYLQDNGYHVDFASIPKAITPMNRIIVAEQRK